MSHEKRDVSSKKGQRVTFKYIKEIVAKENIRWELSGRDSGAIAVSGQTLPSGAWPFLMLCFVFGKKIVFFYHRARGRLIYVNSWS